MKFVGTWLAKASGDDKSPFKEMQPAEQETSPVEKSAKY